MIKLLALDLDGTLLDSAGNISETNRLAIREAEARGVLVTIATGRRFRDARPVGIEAQLNAPLISHNGALIKSAQTGDTLKYSELETKTALEIVEIGFALGATPLVSTNPFGTGTLLYDQIEEENTPLDKYITWSETVHGAESLESIVQVKDIRAALVDEKLIHISFSGNCPAMKKLENILKGTLKLTANVFTTEYPKRNFTLLDVLSPEASKGIALQYLADLKNIKQEEVMVIGDNYNDVEMLEYSQFPVVMGNAEPELLERKEFYTTLTNNDDGVATAIEEFILGDFNGK